MLQKPKAHHSIEKNMKLMSEKYLGPKSCLWPNNGHAKRASLITEWHPEEIPGVTNKQYHSKELNQGFAFLFFPSALLWPLRKLDLISPLISLLATV
jgi:hypothetical protein